MKCLDYWYCNGDCSQCDRKTPDYDEDAEAEYANRLYDSQKGET